MVESHDDVFDPDCDAARHPDVVATDGLRGGTARGGVVTAR